MIKMKAEKVLEKMLTDGVEASGGWCLKFLPYAFNGFPDRIVLLPRARIFFIELKAEGKKSGSRKGERLQNWVQKKLQAFGFTVLILNTTEKINEFLKSI